MPGEAIPGMKLGKGKEGSFRVASGEVVSNLAFLKLEGPGTFDGSQIEIGAQVVETQLHSTERTRTCTRTLGMGTLERMHMRRY